MTTYDEQNFDDIMDLVYVFQTLEYLGLRFSNAIYDDIHLFIAKNKSIIDDLKIPLKRFLCSLLQVYRHSQDNNPNLSKTIQQLHDVMFDNFNLNPATYPKQESCLPTQNRLLDKINQIPEDATVTRKSIFGALTLCSLRYPYEELQGMPEYLQLFLKPLEQKLSLEEYVFSYGLEKSLSKHFEYASNEGCVNLECLHKLILDFKETASLKPIATPFDAFIEQLLNQLKLHFKENVLLFNEKPLDSRIFEIFPKLLSVFFLNDKVKKLETKLNGSTEDVSLKSNKDYTELVERRNQLQTVLPFLLYISYINWNLALTPKQQNKLLQHFGIFEDSDDLSILESEPKTIAKYIQTLFQPNYKISLGSADICYLLHLFCSCLSACIYQESLQNNENELPSFHYINSIALFGDSFLHNGTSIASSNDIFTYVAELADHFCDSETFLPVWFLLEAAFDVLESQKSDRLINVLEQYIAIPYFQPQLLYYLESDNFCIELSDEYLQALFQRFCSWATYKEIAACHELSLPTIQNIKSNPDGASLENRKALARSFCLLYHKHPSTF